MLHVSTNQCPSSCPLLFYRTPRVVTGSILFTAECKYISGANNAREDRVVMGAAEIEGWWGQIGNHLNLCLM